MLVISNITKQTVRKRKLSISLVPTLLIHLIRQWTLFLYTLPNDPQELYKINITWFTKVTKILFRNDWKALKKIHLKYTEIHYGKKYWNLLQARSFKSEFRQVAFLLTSNYSVFAFIKYHKTSVIQSSRNFWALKILFPQRGNNKMNIGA